MLEDFLNLSEDAELHKSVNELLSNPSRISENSSHFVSSYSSSNMSSSESVNVEKIAKKTKEIKEQIINRLSGFMLMSQKCYESDEEYLNVGNCEDSKKSLGVSKSFASCRNNQEELELKGIVEQILGLQKEFMALEKRLCSAKDEIKHTEEEEEELKNHMDLIEEGLGRFKTEEANAKKASCDCVLM